MYPANAYEQRDHLIQSHLDFVEFLIYRMRPQIPPFVSLDDLRSAALQGLMEAATRFDSGRGVMFKTYAEIRIRGAIRDELQKMDWFSRSMREKHNRVCREIQRLEQQLNRSPTEEEIAEALGMDLAQYHKLLSEIGHLGIVSLHELLDNASSGDTFMDQLQDGTVQNLEEAIGRKELVRLLANAMERLTEKERLVVTLFYYEEFTQKEIARILELSEGRISQLHSQALIKLKAALQH